MLAAAVARDRLVALCIGAIVSLGSGLALFGITLWFTVPGFLLAGSCTSPPAARRLRPGCWARSGATASAASSCSPSGWPAPAGRCCSALRFSAAQSRRSPAGCCAACSRRRHSAESDVVAVLFLLVSVPAIVGLPFAHVAEPVPQGRAYRAYFTADMIWRMAVVAEVSKGDVPPRNPFLRGEPLHYYWLPHLLPAAEYRQVHRQISMEQVLLVNSVALGLAFVLFLFGFARQWVQSPVARRARIARRAGVHELRRSRALVVFWRTGVRLIRGCRSEHRRGHALVLCQPADRRPAAAALVSAPSLDRICARSVGAAGAGPGARRA